LILTADSDLHANAVIKELTDRCPDFGVIRINTDCLSTNLDYNFHWTESGELQSQVLTALDSGVIAKNVRVVWYRKPDVPPAHPALTHPITQKCSVLEYQEFLRSFVGLFPEAKWVKIEVLSALSLARWRLCLFYQPVNPRRVEQPDRRGCSICTGDVPTANS